MLLTPNRAGYADARFDRRERQHSEDMHDVFRAIMAFKETPAEDWQRHRRAPPQPLTEYIEGVDPPLEHASAHRQARARKGTGLAEDQAMMRLLELDVYDALERLDELEIIQGKKSISSTRISFLRLLDMAELQDAVSSSTIQEKTSAQQRLPLSSLRDALESVRMFNASPEVDEIATEAGEKVSSLIQSMLAGVQRTRRGCSRARSTRERQELAYGQIQSGVLPA